MKEYCPKCDQFNEVTVQSINEAYKVKGEDTSVIADVAICSACDEKLASPELDERTLQKAFLIYREKHNLLSPDQIATIRNKYALSQRALSKLLEWGEVTIHRYESGALQDPAHNEVLMFIDDPKNMDRITAKNGQLLQKNVYEKLKVRINELLDDNINNEVTNILGSYLDRNIAVNEYSGYSHYDIEKMKDMILYIVSKDKKTFPTKLNKLLWYSDFLYFKNKTKSISGSDYVHHHYGPVPRKFQLLLATMIDDGVLEANEVLFPDGSAGLEYSVQSPFDDSIFNEEEKKVMNYVIDHFKDFNATQIKDYSHKEKGYSETLYSQKISYRYAADLSLSTAD